MYLIIFQHVLFEAFFDIFYFPVWWYTVGVKRSAAWSARLLQSGNEMLAPGLWFKNIFVPMFGQYDWQGRLVSFFMRLVQIVFRTLALLVWLAICLILFACWLLLPIVIAHGLFVSLMTKST